MLLSKILTQDALRSLIRAFKLFENDPCILPSDTFLCIFKVNCIPTDYHDI